MKKLIGALLLSVCFTTSAFAKVHEYTSNNKLTLLEDPVAAVDFKVELIKKAVHHVTIVTFFWDASSVPTKLANALNEANARGVEVRILTTFIPTLTKDFLGKGKKILNLDSNTAIFAYMMMMPGREFSISSNLHEKIFIVDGKKAIIGGRNSSSTSLNGKDMEVLIEGSAVNQVQDHVRIMLDFLVEEKIKAKCLREDSEACEASIRKVQFSANDEKFFPEHEQIPDGVEARILTHEALLHQHEKSMSREEKLSQKDDILDSVIKIKFKKLRMYNYFVMPTERFQNYLNANLAEGNSIELIMNSIETAKFSNNSGYIYSLPETSDLVDRGILLYQWQKNQKLSYVHEKVLVFDEDHVIIGSHNLGTGSTSVSNEIAIEFKSKPIADRLIEVFDHEKTNPLITTPLLKEELDKQISKNKRRIKFLRTLPVRSLLREVY